MVKRLERDVWVLDNCAGCGLCVAACSKQVLGWNGGDNPILEKRVKVVGYSNTALDSCTFCEKFCEEACPRLEHWTEIEPKVVLASKARGPSNPVLQTILSAASLLRAAAQDYWMGL